MRTLSLAVMTLALVGCKKDAESSITAKIPETEIAEKFATRLVGLSLNGWNPADTKDLEISAMKFMGDGTWTAQGTHGGARCDESGRWTIEKMDGADTAHMMWTVRETSCAGRKQGDAKAVQVMMLDGGNYKIVNE